MTADTLLYNGKLLRNNKLREGCVAFSNGKISYVGDKTNSPEARERINLDGGLILPGLIDAHTHLRDMLLAEKEDFNSGTRSALAGGFTSVADMPNTKPVTDNFESLKEKIEVAQTKIVANVAFYGAFNSDLKQVEDMAKIGIAGFKIFANKRDPFNGDDDQLVENALGMAKRLELPVAFHAEDLKTVENSENRLKEQGKDFIEAFAFSHPPLAERLSIARIIRMVSKSRTLVHFCHLSTKGGLALVNRAKAVGLPVTCEVTPHHLFLSEREVEKEGNVAIVDPPLRKRRHKQALLHGLQSSQIDLVASDHAPHTLTEKMSPRIWNVPPGFPGLETTLPLMMTAVSDGKLSMKCLTEVLAERPSKLLGLGTKGFLSKGFDADITVVDTARRFRVNPNDFQSKAKYSPFTGFEATGKAVKVFLQGRLVMLDGDVLADSGSGHVLRRG